MVLDNFPSNYNNNGNYSNNNSFIVSGGGVLTYLSLLAQGLQSEYVNIINARRVYSKNSRNIEITNIYCKSLNQVPNSLDKVLLIDDILASGRTISSIKDKLDFKNADLLTLITSLNIRSSDLFRTKNCSTVRGFDKVYTGVTIDSMDKSQKPAIFSFRYLLEKSSDKNYINYFKKKFKNEENFGEYFDVVQGIDKEPLVNLRKDEISFIKNFRGNKK